MYDNYLLLLAPLAPGFYCPHESGMSSGRSIGVSNVSRLGGWRGKKPEPWTVKTFHQNHRIFTSPGLYHRPPLLNEFNPCSAFIRRPRSAQSDHLLGGRSLRFGTPNGWLSRQNDICVRTHGRRDHCCYRFVFIQR
jgi:hypothetical protein